MKKITFLIIPLIILFFGNLKSQNNGNKPLRVEIEVESGEDDLIRAMPAGKNGVVILQIVDSDQKGKDKYSLTIYDTDFVRKTSKTFYVNKKMELKQHYYDEKLQKLYAYFSRKKQDNKYEVISFTLQNQEIKSLSGIDQIKGDLIKFVAQNDIVYWSGYHLPLPNSLVACLPFTCIGLPIYFYSMYKIPVGYIVCNNFKTMKTEVKILPGKGSTRVIDICPDENGNLDAFVENIDKGGKNPLYKTMYKKIDPSLKEIESTGIPASGGKRLLSSTVTRLKNNEKVLVGSYSSAKITKKLNVNVAYKRETSEGLYFSVMNNDETKFIKYYPFSKFKNYYEYYNQRFAKRLARKEAKRASQGKQSLLQHMQLIHDVITLKNGDHVVVSEIYYPEYETRCYTTVGANGQTSTNCYQVFVGYRYTRALIVGFNKEGELLWDQNFPIGDILTFDLKQRVKVMLANDESLIFLYNNAGSINSLTIKNGEKISDGKEVVKLETNFSEDKVKGNWNSDADFWYDKYFITYGIQKIKNKDKQADKRKRTVFYFNKIQYE